MDVKSSIKMISVIVPMYNAESSIEKCVNSIVNQTYKNIEIILVNDGSTDSTLEKCTELAACDSRIRIINKENGGQQSARNEGIKNVKGEYIGFVDADDWIDCNMYENLILMIENNDIVSSSIKRVNSNTNQIEIWNDNLAEGVYRVNDDYLQNNLIIYSHYSGGKVIGGITNNMVNKLYRSDVVKNIFNKLQEVILDEEDFYFNILAILNSASICISHRAFYNYVINTNGMSQKSNENYIAERAILYRNIKHEIEKFNNVSMLIQLQRRISYELVSAGVKMGFSDCALLPMYSCEMIDQIYNKRIIIFGLGNVGKSYIKILKENNKCQVLGYLDNKERCTYEGVQPLDMNELMKIDYDYIVCSVDSKMQADEMWNQLKTIGIDDEKVIWEKPYNYYKDFFLGGE
ncbi:Glycosyltransferase involved in cell wall bisynthesis [Pseudobutyrivibrio sp. ACV-2]|nr:Glycosyltransferase involved in cell wall bisynthesis [Pseudobutyrivibrio sp. ACV-2]